MTANLFCKYTDKHKIENRKKQTRRILCSSVFLSVLFCVITPANAQTSDQIQLMVAPEMFELQLEKGEVYKNRIKIRNKGENPIPLQAIAENFDTEEESGTAIFYKDPAGGADGDSAAFNPRKWMKIENPNFILDSQETASIKFSISVPENAEDGGYYTAIFLEPMTSASRSNGAENSSVKVLPKIGVLFLITIGERDPNRIGDLLAIAEFGIPEKFHLKKLENSLASITGLFQSALAENRKSLSIVETSRLQFDLIVKNNDIFHNKPYGKLSILSSGGKAIGETEIRKTTILPGRSRKIPVEFELEIPGFAKKLPVPISNFISKNLLFGKFYAELALNVEDKMTTEKIEFWIFPWKTAVWIFIILAAMLILRKRIVMAIKVILLNPKSKSQ